MSTISNKDTINTIIFDIGNVLITFDFYTFMHELFTDETTIEAVTTTLFRTGYWNNMDLGIWGDEEILSAAIAKSPDYEEAIRLTYSRIGECVHSRDYAATWIEELKSRGCRVLYLSNYSKQIMDGAPGVLDFVPLMDGGIFSCDVNLVKPDPAIYELLREKYKLDFTKCVFLDDTKENLETAASLGLNTVHFQNYEQGKAALENLL